MLHGISAPFSLPAGTCRQFGAMLAGLEVRVGLGVDLGRVHHVAEALRLRFVRIDRAARGRFGAAEQRGDRHGCNAEQRALEHRAARKVFSDIGYFSSQAGIGSTDLQ